MTDIEEILNFDPLSEAESITGKSYKEDEDTLKTGLALHLMANEGKRDALSARGDTHWGVTWAGFHDILEAEGFEKVLSLPFHNTKWDMPEQEFMIWFHPDGLLLKADSWHMTNGDMKINGTSVYGNLRCEGRSLWSIPMSHGPVDGHDNVRSFNLDCREGMRYRLQQIRDAGELLNPWISPYLTLWLIHHGDDIDSETGYEARSKKYKGLAAERIAMLPGHVQACINL